MFKYIRNKKEIILLVILVLLALFTRIININLLFGLTINFVSIFFLVLLYLYGKKTAYLIIITIQALTTIFTNVDILSNIVIFEILFIGILDEYKPKLNLLIKDLMFWVIGSVILIIAIRLNLEYISHDREVIIYFIFNIVVNSLINALIVDIIITYFTFDFLTNGNSRYKRDISFNNFLLHISFIAVLGPFIINLFWSNNIRYKAINLKVKEETYNVVTDVDKYINNLSKDDKRKLYLYGTIQIGMIEDFIKNNLENNSMKVTLLDKDKKIMVTNKQTIEMKEVYNIDQQLIIKECGNNISQRLPAEDKNIPYIEKWADSNFIFVDNVKDSNISIVVEYPVIEEKESIKMDFMNQIRFILLIALCVLAIAATINKVVINKIMKLAKITTDIPNKLGDLTGIKWPRSNIVETKMLIDNFERMTSTLKDSQMSLEKMAYYDTLTKLPNRINFKSYVEEIWNKYKDTDIKIAIIFMDIDGFKQINDTLGHHEGDKLLGLIAGRLLTLDRETVRVFRLGGDEFVTVSVTETLVEIEEISEEILQLFDKNFDLEGGSYKITASLGISVFPDHTDNISDLIKNADMAMYKCKENGGNYPQLFTEGIKRQFINRVDMEKGIRRALDQDLFSLYYQPKVNVKTNKISSMEALLRWGNKEEGFISPEEFIAIAEETNLIIEIDKWVILEACKQNIKWQREKVFNIPVAVNISARHFDEGKVLELVKYALEETGLDPKYLKIEITESVLINDLEETKTIIEKLKDIGVGVSIDDFGRGYSSLNQLINLPVSEVKIDRDFIIDINEYSKKAVVVKLIVELAHSLNLNVVAEGIESIEEFQYLKSVNCDEIQGYIFTKPLSSEDFTEYVTNFKVDF